MKASKATKKLLVEKYVEKWLNEKSQLGDELRYLASEVVWFNAKWGTKFSLNMEDDDVIPR